jgi:hypothetical protein
MAEDKSTSVPKTLDNPSRVDAIDMFAYMILKDFIASGFPKPDPEIQVRAAYTYAQLMIKVREEL